MPVCRSAPFVVPSKTKSSVDLAHVKRWLPSAPDLLLCVLTANASRSAVDRSTLPARVPDLRASHRIASEVSRLPITKSSDVGRYFGRGSSAPQAFGCGTQHGCSQESAGASRGIGAIVARRQVRLGPPAEACAAALQGGHGPFQVGALLDNTSRRCAMPPFSQGLQMQSLPAGGRVYCR